MRGKEKYPNTEKKRRVGNSAEFNRKKEGRRRKLRSKISEKGGHPVK